MPFRNSKGFLEYSLDLYYPQGRCLCAPLPLNGVPKADLYPSSSSLVRQSRSQTPQSALRDTMATTAATEDQPQIDESVGSGPQTSDVPESMVTPSLSPIPSQGMPNQGGPISPPVSPDVVSPLSYNDDATPTTLKNVGTFIER